MEWAERYLREAEARIKLGKQHIECQRQAIAELEQAGRDATAARELLRTTESLQALRIERFKQLRREVAA